MTYGCMNVCKHISVNCSVRLPSLHISKAERIFCKLINRELNKELLNEVPNILCLDLAVVFVCAVENEEFGNGSILVREEHRKLWRISKELLYEYARENTFRLRPFELKSMEELIEDMVEPEEKKLLKEIPM